MHQTDKISALIDRCEADCASVFRQLEGIEQANTRKVLESFQKHAISSRHFSPSTGYGYDDIGRDTLGSVYADVFRAEAALVRPQIASGTHALAMCLYGVLRTGDTMLSAAGKPYDTLEEVIGISGASGQGSLKEFGIEYRQAELTDEGRLDLNAIGTALDARVKLVLIQRSRGYDWRPSLSVEEIGEAARHIHRLQPDAVVMVDNCYGEFTDLQEPIEAGADLIAGSLIKNPGGGLAPSGGYIAGRADLIEKVACRMTSPGIGAEVGAYAASYRPFYQGLFLAPHVSMQAVKTAVLAARVFSEMGYAVHPAFSDPRNDIIQAIRFEKQEKLLDFVRAIQANSPIDSMAVPEPWDMPGYQHQVVMAAGTFVGGASIELSADAPIKPPYIGYMQGSLTYAHGRIAIEGAARALAAD